MAQAMGSSTGRNKPVPDCEYTVTILKRNRGFLAEYDYTIKNKNHEEVETDFWPTKFLTKKLAKRKLKSILKKERFKEGVTNPEVIYKLVNGKLTTKY